MLLKRFYDSKLAQASYLVGCQATKEAIVVDANRDIGQYLRAAGEEGVRITHVTETHIHADFVSGSRELAECARATLLLSAEGGDDWSYTFAKASNAVLLHHGDVIQVGNVRLDVIHTPGHTPEHLSFVITDTRASERPMGMLTGDFIFVGDVGRPDLLERAANVAGSMEQGARALYDSLQHTTSLPDYLQLWPGHGAGSACGKALGALPSSTLGYERIANWAFSNLGEGEFIAEVLAGQPEPPKYFGIMKRINRDGPRSLGGFHRPAHMDSSTLESTIANGGVVVDTRAATAFADHHVRGAINIPLNKTFTNWAGSLLPYDTDVYLLVDTDQRRNLDEAIRDLAMIGLDRIAGYFGLDALDTLTNPSQRTKQVDVTTLRESVENGAYVLDVRNDSEWNEAHIDGAHHISLGSLEDRLAEIPRDRPVMIHCQGGSRSAIAASLLEAHGFDDVSNVSGGFGAWIQAGLPVMTTSGRA